ncbi:hypothetical protein Ahy_A07g032501 isoform D [Arachis hypogaea]|uniref:NAD-dependent epimerase/dehydratase domain-containing protein n=1 Tax=Arachis hypogaea TaxID=3818 RepID=A0A445C749_ARAHY|nr:hypothetical protein Ahy_A07g032501 isoform D [Arachis hypogaea]
MSESEVVCVTGGSGCIGSWLVHLLLTRGYTVHATVKDLKDDTETKHLEALEGASTRLRLFQIDLLQYETIVAAVRGCSGKELLDPAIRGTMNVLEAAKEAGVKRVVVTSSVSAITPSPGWPSDVVKTEDCWTDTEYCKQKGFVTFYSCYSNYVSTKNKMKTCLKSRTMMHNFEAL